MDKYGLDTGEISWREYKEKFPKRITDQSVKAAFMWIWKKQDQRWRDARREMTRGRAKRADVPPPMELTLADRHDIVAALRIASGYSVMVNAPHVARGYAELRDRFKAYWAIADAYEKEIPF